MVIVAEAGYGIWTLTKPVAVTPSLSPSPQVESGGKIMLLSAKKDYQVGETLPVTIGMTNGSKATIATDIVIRFDPKILEASGGAFEKGPLYSNYSKLIIDGELGILQVSGFTDVGRKPVLGTGVFGKINFKVKQPGTTRLTVDFTPLSTVDSNMMEAGTGKDILEKVTNLNVTTILK